jgi:hypothetical protein
MAAAATEADLGAAAGLGRKIGLRWTIGDVSERGFEALRLSVWGAWHVFGPEAGYTIGLNTVPLAEAKRRTGTLPQGVEWRVAEGRLPDFLRPHLDDGMAEGVAWKFDPLRIYPERFEIALDNDCILWRMPSAMARWLDAAPSDVCLLAEDVRPAFGAFAELCGPAPRNTGIRGLPPGFDLGDALRRALARNPIRLASELDEQGMQVAALSERPPFVVSTDDVTICSPFHPHLPHLGVCGAHFVGQNVRRVPWDYYDRPGMEVLVEHWERHRPAIYERVGLALDAPQDAQGQMATG